MGYCPRCGASVEEGAGFCTNCGARLEVGSVEVDKVLHVSTQGIDIGYNFTGSYDEVDWGYMTLEDVYAMLENIPKVYPPWVSSVDDFCPINIILRDNRDNTLAVSLVENNTFMASYLTEKGESIDFYDLSLDQVYQHIRTFYDRYASPGARTPPLGRVIERFDVYFPGTQLKTTLAVAATRILGIPYENVLRVDLKKGGFLRGSPTISILYNEGGRTSRLIFTFAKKGDVEKCYRILANIIPEKVFLS